MININIGANEEGQRLDRFLRKYFAACPLSTIYKMIRKDVKVNGKRGREEQILKSGDVVALYMSEELAETYRGKSGSREAAGSRTGRQGGSARPKREFSIIYEDADILVADKPFGLLTHGDAAEKKHHLANQVVDYLIEKGEYSPRTEKTFVPAPANRLDRNTTGLVLFGKNAAALRALNALIRERNCIEKYYLSILVGDLKEQISLRGFMTKDEAKNRSVSVAGDGAAKGSRAADEKTRGADAKTRAAKEMLTVARPIERASGFTLAEIRILTGRTHQIRLQMAEAGYPVIGDAKYGDTKANRFIKDAAGLSTQLLHSHRLVLADIKDICDKCGASGLAKLEGREFIAHAPEQFDKVKEALWNSTKIKTRKA